MTADLQNLRITEGETESRVDETDSETSETGANRQPRGHLTQGAHNHVDNQAHKGIRDEDGGRTSFRKSLEKSLVIVSSMNRSTVVVHTDPVPMINPVPIAPPMAEKSRCQP